MKKVAIIGASYLQNPLILKAKEMGMETHAFAWKCGDIGEKTADYFYPISIVEKEAILDKCREIGVDAVCSISSDLAWITVNYVANHMGLPANAPESIGPCTNKYLMRQTLQKAGISVPKYGVYTAGETIRLPDGMTFPAIVKPTDRSGSRGIMKVERAQDVEEAVRLSVEHSFEKKAIVEEFIDGPEYSCEGVSFDGKHHIVAITKKFTTNAPHFIETGHVEPSDLTQAEYDLVCDTVVRALDALNISNGISHSEFRMSPDGTPRIIEIGARMGGDCIGSHLVMLSTGLDFVRMALECALGQKPTMDPVIQPRCAAVRFILTQEDMAVLNRIRQLAPETLYEVEVMGTPGEYEVSDSSNRFGYYIVADADQERVRDLIGL